MAKRYLLPFVLVATACAGACGDSSGTVLLGTPASASASAAASGPALAPADPAKRRPPRTRQGSGIALTPDGSTLVVADEDHAALLLAPTSMEASTQVVPLPGPPAQVVVLDGLVFVTVRTLPTDASAPAMAKIRGALPTPAAARVLPLIDTAQMDSPTSPLPKGGEVDPAAPPASAAPSASSASSAPHGKPDKSAAPRAASASAKPKGSAAKPPAPQPPTRGTPAAPFDPLLVRQSQGGLLIALGPGPDGALVELGRVTLAPDAWGLAVTPDDHRAVVTSAWSHEVAVVDVATPSAMKVVSHAEVAREPRGVAITADGKTAFVSHLVGAPLTKITGLDGTPSVAPQPLPTARARGPQGIELAASLGYAPVLSPDDRTLFVPRHALGAEGIGSWWGAPTVDTLDVASGRPLQPAHVFGSPSKLVDTKGIIPAPAWAGVTGLGPMPREELVQPRAAVYRASTDTLLVASEGEDTLTEIDALAADPAMAVRNVFWLGREYDKFGQYPASGGAPSAVVLSTDEKVAYVWCRTTFDVARIDLETKRAQRLHLADDGLPADAALGRRLYMNATSNALSGGIGCAGCHPDGRDDGYTWREGELEVFSGPVPRFVGLRQNVKVKSNFPSDKEPAGPPKLYARQTPMLAGRTRADGPYGWHAESPNLLARLLVGFDLHREAWGQQGGSWYGGGGAGQDVAKVDYLADYMRSGLLPPPVVVHPQTEEEKRGQEIFESKTAQCSTCHVTEGGMTDRKAHELAALPLREGFDAEDNRAYKTPSLWFIEGTAPYFHDGSAATLEDLVRTNAARMGNTAHLSTEDQRALVAYMRTL
jgi:DNA-binding beta-propeller fold protein YncE